MPGHEGVEEMPERREGLVLRGRAPRQLLQEPAGLTGRDLGACAAEINLLRKRGIGPYFPDFSANRTTMHLKIVKICPRFPTFSLRSFLRRRLLAQLQALALAPGEKLADGPGVGPASVGVGDPRGEELVRGEAGGPAGAHEDRRKGRFKIISGPRISGFQEEFPGAHDRVQQYT